MSSRLACIGLLTGSGRVSKHAGRAVRRPQELIRTGCLCGGFGAGPGCGGAKECSPYPAVPSYGFTDCTLGLYPRSAPSHCSLGVNP